LIDGNGGTPISKGAILIEDDTIIDVGEKGKIKIPENAEVEKIYFENETLLPGLVDCHVHLNGFGDGRFGDDLALLPDEILTLQAAKNARSHLYSGVTTIRDLGSKHKTSLLLRKAIEMGITVGPRMILCGRPVAIIGGHMHYFGIEATGVDEGRKAVRQLMKDGADMIKITATGGSTRTSFPFRSSFNLDELKAIISEAHKFGKHTAAHLGSSEAMLNCLKAGVDTIIHCGYHEPDGTIKFRKEVADRIVKQEVFVNPTLSQSFIPYMDGRITDKKLIETKLIKEKKDGKFSKHVANIQRTVDMGAKLVAGSDSSWSTYPMGSFQYEIIAHVEDIGLSPMEGIVSATRDSAKSLWINDTVGTLEKGKKADILIVKGNPAQNIHNLWNVVTVFLGGKEVKKNGSL